jgi:23S rRNA pseudouridine2605 synthase
MPTQELGVKVDPVHDTVAVDGRPLAVAPREYWVLHKPPGVIATVSDPLGRTTARDLVPSKARVFPVGRMDAQSAGLLLFTNDGDLAYALTRPTCRLDESFDALVSGRPVAADLRRLRRGMYLGEEKAAPMRAHVSDMPAPRGRSWVHVEVSGSGRMLRRAFDALGHPVRQVVRVQLGPVSMQGLDEGAARTLTAAEQTALLKVVDQARSGRD